MNYTAVIKEEGDWWIGWIEEIPGVNCQEATREQLLETLRVTLREVLELNRADALDAAGSEYEELEISVLCAASEPRESSLDEISGATGYRGPKKSLEEIKAGIAEGARADRRDTRDELFSELVESVREGGAILRGEVAPSKAYEVQTPRGVLLDDQDPE